MSVKDGVKSGFKFGAGWVVGCILGVLGAFIIFVNFVGIY